MSVYERYRQDALFQKLVDVLECQIADLKLTPTEVREAAMLASVHFEQRTLRRYFVIPVRSQDCIEPRQDDPWKW